MTKDLKITSWDSRKASCCAAACFSCGKQRIFFTSNKALYNEKKFFFLAEGRRNSVLMWQCLFFLQPYGNLGQVFVQRMSLSCDLPIEKKYYDNQGWDAKSSPIYFFCGSTKGVLEEDELASRAK